MDDSVRYPGAVTKVPRVYCGLRCDGYRVWAFHINRGVPSYAACDPVRSVAVIPCGGTATPRLTEDIHQPGMTTEGKLA